MACSTALVASAVSSRKPKTLPESNAPHMSINPLPESPIRDSINAVNFSSACTAKRFPSRCASAMKIVRPLESTAEPQPKLQPALLRLSAIISQYFTRLHLYLFFPQHCNDELI